MNSDNGNGDIAAPATASGFGLPGSMDICTYRLAPEAFEATTKRRVYRRLALILPLSIVLGTIVLVLMSAFQESVRDALPLAIPLILIAVAVGAFACRRTRPRPSTSTSARATASAKGRSNLGLAYASATGGMAKDEAKAVNLYERACDRGNADGCSNLGFAYASGAGSLAKDEVKAVSLYRQACDGGSPQGCSNLGIAYENGRGDLPKDRVKAAVLFERACDRGSLNGCKQRDRLRLEMHPYGGTCGRGKMRRAGAIGKRVSG